MMEAIFASSTCAAAPLHRKPCHVPSRPAAALAPAALPHPDVCVAWRRNALLCSTADAARHCQPQHPCKRVLPNYAFDRCAKLVRIVTRCPLASACVCACAPAGARDCPDQAARPELHRPGGGLQHRDGHCTQHGHHCGGISRPRPALLSCPPARSSRTAAPCYQLAVKRHHIGTNSTLPVAAHPAGRSSVLVGTSASCPRPTCGRSRPRTSFRNPLSLSHLLLPFRFGFLL